MIQLEIAHKSERSVFYSKKSEILIGKAPHCDLVLKGWFIAGEHARLRRLSGGYAIEDVRRGSNVTLVNERKIDFYGPLDVQQDVIGIGAYHLRIVPQDAAIDAAGALPERSHNVMSHSISHANADGESPSQRMGSALDQAMVTSSEQVSPVSVPSQPRVTETSPLMALEQHWCGLLRARLVKAMDMRRLDITRLSEQQLREQVREVLDRVLFEAESELPAELSLPRLAKRVLDEVVGLGPLESLLADAQVTEIMVNARDEIFVERQGQIQRSPLTFSSDRAVLEVIERIVTPLGRRIDESSPMVDARLSDGSRVNAIIPPLALKGPTLTIRKFPQKRLDSAALVAYGSLSPEMAEFLQICVRYKKNILISGGTGSGKTTLLNVLSGHIPRGERLITIEDAAELRLDHDHLIALEARPGNAEGKGQVPIRDLVRNSLRMRPDRIVIGECRGAETLDMLQAMNTGHEGSLTTLHANTPRDALARMETLVMMAGMELPLSAIRDQMQSAIDIIVQQTRFSCGSRKITHITEVTGMESGKIQMQDIFRFERTGFDPDSHRVLGSFRAAGVTPSFYDDLKAIGAPVDFGLFTASREGWN